MEAWELQRVRDEEHLNILGIFNFVFAGLCLLGAVAFIPHLIFIQSGWFDQMFDRQWEKIEDRAEQQGEEFPVVLDEGLERFLRQGIRYFVVGFMLLMAFGGVLCLLSGLSLRAHRRRGLSLFVAALQCLAMPVGTVLGVFTLVIVGRESVRELYLEAKHPGFVGESEDGR